MVSWAERIAIGEAKRKCGHYGGCGCAAYQGCCETCPFPECKLDAPSRLRRSVNMLRNIEICRLKQGGMPVPELAGRFSLSERNVFRIIAEG